MNNKMQIAVVGMAIAISCGIVVAAPIGIQHTWSTAGNTATWTVGGSSYSSFDAGTYGGQAALGIIGGSGSPGLVKNQIFTDSGDSGNGPLAPDVDYYSNVQSIKFDFYANATTPGDVNDEPGALKLYFVGNGVTWYYDILGISSGWHSYYANTFYPAWPSSWYRTDGGTNSATTWATAFSSVDRIGFEVSYRPSLAGQEYAFDNFELDDDPVPEPTTWAMIAFALISMAVTFRGKLTASLASVRSYMGR